MRASTVCRLAAWAVVTLLTASSDLRAQGGDLLPSPVTVGIVAAPPPPAGPASAWLALRFDIEDGWHIYWQNPGDSGGPPEVRWELPPGVTSGPLLWPTPERIAQDTIVSYGYHNQVVLPAAVTAAGGWPARPFVVGAQVKWLACRDICLPGKAAVSTTVPAGFALPADAGASIRAALARVPDKAPDRWRLSGAAEGDSFTIDIETGEPEVGTAFFPLRPGQVDGVALPRPESYARGVRFVLRRSDYLSAPVVSLKGVVVLSGGRSYVVDVPLADGGRASAGGPGAHGRQQAPDRAGR